MTDKPIMCDDDEIERLREDNAKLHRAIEEMTRSYVARCNENDKLRDELQNIANANPSQWGEQSDQFQPWAQNRARHALEAKP